MKNRLIGHTIFVGVYFRDILVSILLTVARVAMQPGKPGKVIEFDICPKSQGISAFYLKFWKSQGI